MNPTQHQSPRGATRRRFLAATALPLAIAGRESLAADGTCGCPKDLLGAARAYGKLVPAWTEAAQARAAAPTCPQATARFDALDPAYDQAKRHLLRLMRAAGRPVVADREAGQLYIDCSPAGSHEDVDRLLPETAVVRVVPLADVLQG